MLADHCGEYLQVNHMEPDLLGQLLRQADRMAGEPPPVPADLAGRVRRLARQRRRAHTRNALVAAGLAVAIGALMRSHLPQHREPAPAPVAGDLDPSVAQQLLAIKTEADQLRARLLAEDPAAPPADPDSQAEPSDRPAGRSFAETNPVEQELERAAYLIVYQAERYQRELGMPESAVASYRQTIELFPQTRAARTARDRLTQLEPVKGNPL